MFFPLSYLPNYLVIDEFLNIFVTVLLLFDFFFFLFSFYCSFLLFSLFISILSSLLLLPHLPYFIQYKSVLSNSVLFCNVLSYSFLFSSLFSALFSSLTFMWSYSLFHSSPFLSLSSLLLFSFLSSISFFLFFFFPFLFSFFFFLFSLFSSLFFLHKSFTTGKRTYSTFDSQNKKLSKSVYFSSLHCHPLDILMTFRPSPNTFTGKYVRSIVNHLHFYLY